MRSDDALLVSQLCAARAGLKVDPEKTYLLESRLAPVARRDGFGSIADLLASLRAKREERTIWAIVEAMTMGETSFFRDHKPFIRFRDEVLPDVVRRRSGSPVRIWSAACAAGQEVYSLAMLVDGQSPHLSGARIELYGSDLNERALEKAQSGLYTQFEVQRGLPIRQLVQHFEKADDMWILSPRIRQMVRWRRINLVGDLSALGQFDVIFCRYLLSSLVAPMRARVLESLAMALAPGGYLVLGEGETAAAITDALQPLAGDGGLFGRNPAFRAAA
ncbi:protein-glutamate O-methyltransferase CheR [Phenylobacterium sp.]|jgi:chemotaxis protein methyltransferase CheR|uniref:CheR family methyltransferase n=1 Tax=Phenylobacterium sp. TaxID=1871053 RepID=UPI002F3EB5D8